MISEEIQKYFSVDYRGVLLEVGAGFPELGSPVSPLRKAGWKIISVEPNPVLCNEFIKLGLPILQYAAYSEDLGMCNFNISSNGLSYSSLDFPKINGSDMSDITGEFTKDTAIGNGLSNDFNWQFFPKSGGKKTIKVNTLTLNTILKRHHKDVNNINAIIVDVEGHEMEVLKGIDLEKYSPEVIVVENIGSNSHYRDYMDEKGYSINNRIDIDDIYIKK